MALRRDPVALLIALVLLGASTFVVWRLERERRARPPGPTTSATWEWARRPPARAPWLGTTGAPGTAAGRTGPPPRVVEVDGNVVAVTPRPVERPAPLGDAPLPVRPLPGQAPDPERLGRALALLGSERRAAKVGDYTLHTDVEDPELVAALDRFAAGLEEIYRDRYGLELVGRAAEAIVLYRREEDYRRFEQSEAQLTGIGAVGHTRRGVVAFYRGDRPAAELAGTLVHELAHVLNRRGLGPALPPWLDEGIADDLAQSRISLEDGLLPGTLGGAVVRDGRRIDLRGARASLLLLQRAAEQGAAPRVPLFLEESWEDFVGAEREQLYAGSLFWVRYLLAGEGGALAPGFRAFLRGVAEGRPASPEELGRQLGRPWPHLELGYRAWLGSLDPLADAEPEVSLRSGA